MGQFKRLLHNRIISGSIIAALLLLIAACLLVYSSLSLTPRSLFPYAEPLAAGTLVEGQNIGGTAAFDKDSYLIGDLASYRISLFWRDEVITPDIEAFRNGIGFFPFNRLSVTESKSVHPGGIQEISLQYNLQAVDVETTRSYQLAPPTVYYTVVGNADMQLESFRIDAPVIHIGEFYPANVSGVELVTYKGEIKDPVTGRQMMMALSALLMLALGGGLLRYYGRIRQRTELDDSEQLWYVYRQLDREQLGNRQYLDQCERVFTGLLRYRLQLSPALFWSGAATDDQVWADILLRARELFYRNYLSADPGDETLTEVTSIIDGMFARLTEEDRLRREQQPRFLQRVSSEFGALSSGGSMLLAGLFMFTLTLFPRIWTSTDVLVYNAAVRRLSDNETILAIQEDVNEAAEQIQEPQIKAAALYNLAVLSTRPAMAEISEDQQHALLQVMFQQEKVFIDALLHSLTMEDPFLLVSILRDSVRYLTMSESSLKTATRLAPEDEAIQRNLELAQKRRNAYAETIQELLTQGDDSGGQGELQRQALMDLEMLLQTEMPDKYADFKEGQNNKEYFIMEAF